MLSLDMKYTALYRVLGFKENELDIYVKSYQDYKVVIYAERPYADYGNSIKTTNQEGENLIRHKDFVILECIDRLLEKGIRPKEMILNRDKKKPDIIINNNIAVFCERWGDDFNRSEKAHDLSGYEYSVLYTSRLVSGLLEYRSIILHRNEKYNYGLFEDIADLNSPILTKSKKMMMEEKEDISDFDIFEDELIAYNGNRKTVHIPEGIKTIGASAFWNNTTVEELILPKSLEQLGGDAFYYCTNLKKVNIPPLLKRMGDNPFAGCPNLIDINNESSYFVLNNGVLYNKEKTKLIHYPIAKEDKEFIIPTGVECLGKHCFFSCNNLEKITIPLSVIQLVNNPFSGCEKLQLNNLSEHFIIDNSVIFNKFMTIIIGVLDSAEFEEYIIPESVLSIGRNSFWNCKNIKKIVITKNVNLIGYNPFAGCEMLTLENRNHRFIIKEGLLLKEDETEVLCCTNTAAKNGIKLSDKVKSINRSAFSGCTQLKKIDLNQVEILDKNAFTRCTGLTDFLFIPDTVKYIGEWAFSYCLSLKKVSISKNTKIDRNAFNECTAEIMLRD